MAISIPTRIRGLVEEASTLDPMAIMLENRVTNITTSVESGDLGCCSYLVGLEL
jgi:hypothetical protein